MQRSGIDTIRHAIKEESEVANRDLADYQACSFLQYINVITNFLIMRNYFSKLRQQFSLIHTLSRHKSLVLKAPGAREILVEY